MIRVVVDNHTYTSLYAEHGLSILVDNGKRILFDTGKSKIILKNLKLLDELETFDYVVLSHGHYDHCNGLKYIKELADNIIVHKDALINRYYKNRYIGIDKEVKNLLKDAIFIEDEYKISKDIIVFKSDRKHFYEIDDFRDENNNLDIVKDEISLYYKEYLFVGCSHSGIVNIIETCKDLNKNIKGVIGGFHLINSTDKYIDYVYNYLSKQSFWFSPLHCTGFYALSKLSNLNNFIYGYAGKNYEM